MTTTAPNFDYMGGRNFDYKNPDFAELWQLHEMPKTLDFTGFSGDLPLKKKAGFTRCNKKAISYYMFLYPQARPGLMRAGVCVMMPQEARAISFTG